MTPSCNVFRPLVDVSIALPYQRGASETVADKAILTSSSSRRESLGKAIPLAPQRDVEIVDGRTIATSEEPWLRLQDIRAFTPGGFVEIVYRASLFDDPVRPILRFRTQQGSEIDRLLPGPVAGAAIWVGRVPKGTNEIWISPTHRRGRFDFVIEQARRRNGSALWLRALRRSPRYALSAAFYGVPRFIAEYDMNLDWALGFTPLSEFESWRSIRIRMLDLSDIDAPRSDWINGPEIYVAVTSGHGKEASLRSLSAQTYTRWHLHETGRLPASANDEDLVFVLRAGDHLDPHAFACAIEHAARNPSQQIFYADEIEHGDDRVLRPVFKPDWSPLLQAGRPYLGRAVFARVRLLRDRGAAMLPQDLSACISATGVFPRDAVGHLRRMLLTRSSEPESAPSPGAERAAADLSNALAASIVIPTKDRGDLLEQCVASILANTPSPAYRIVIVDNGSKAPASRAILSRLAHDARVTVLAKPGPFNFAALCNAGAALGNEPVIVFLNDDTRILSADWLARMTLASALPEIGAVGAKLLYPDGRVQHAGVTLGLGEAAGHFGAGATEADAGWAGRHRAVHEVSAVTGACLAVERQKFTAVGGFDSENLPIELNDVDLCLRLGERGWKTVCLSDLSLFHEESASRGGAKFRLLRVHEEERRYFMQRWRRLIRDDPFFHPGFSLFRRAQALG
ncbi:MAG: glycosyltransferase [Methylobacteriaceae bacterium]|nr:glycosyltransferase [Methylobacteriaceae bacterium]